MSLRDFLLAVLGGSIALGPAVYGAVEYLNVFQDVPSEHKRLVVAAVSGLLGVGAWLLAAWLGYSDPIAWAPEPVLSGVWQYGVLTGFSAFTSATVIHGYAKLNEIEVRPVTV